MKLTKSDRIIKPMHVFLFFKCYFTLLTVLLFFEVICATCRSELLKITKYHTTTKIGSPKLNYNFFFHFTAQCDSVHTFAVDGRHCTSREGNYSVLWCLHTNYTNYQRYGFLKICLPSSLLSVMIPMLLIFLEGCAILCPGYRQIRSR